MLKRFFVALMVIFSVNEGMSQVIASEPNATIHVFAVDPFGAPYKGAEIYLSNFDENGKGFTRDGPEAVFEEVPYGRYRLTIKIRGQQSYERLLTVNVAEMWVREGIAIRIADVLGGQFSLKGAVRPRPQQQRHLWARVEGVFLNFVREVPVDQTGKFTIDGLDMGTYVLEIFDGAHLLSAKLVQFDPNTPEIILRLGPN